MPDYFAASLLLTSCDRDASSYALTSSSDDNSTAEIVFDDVYETSMDEATQMDLSPPRKLDLKEKD